MFSDNLISVWERTEVGNPDQLHAILADLTDRVERESLYQKPARAVSPVEIKTVGTRTADPNDAGAQVPATGALVPRKLQCRLYFNIENQPFRILSEICTLFIGDTPGAGTGGTLFDRAFRDKPTADDHRQKVMNILSKKYNSDHVFLILPPLLCRSEETATHSVNTHLRLVFCRTTGAITPVVKMPKRLYRQLEGFQIVLQAIQVCYRHTHPTTLRLTELNKYGLGPRATDRTRA